MHKPTHLPETMGGFKCAGFFIYPMTLTIPPVLDDRKRYLSEDANVILQSQFIYLIGIVSGLQHVGYSLATIGSYIYTTDLNTNCGPP